jgi:hypothetical protein
LLVLDRKTSNCHQLQMLEFTINNDIVLVCLYPLRYLTFTAPSEDTFKPLDRSHIAQSRALLNLCKVTARNLHNCIQKVPYATDIIIFFLRVLKNLRKLERIITNVAVKLKPDYVI